MGGDRAEFDGYARFWCGFAACEKIQGKKTEKISFGQLPFFVVSDIIVRWGKIDEKRKNSLKGKRL